METQKTTAVSIIVPVYNKEKYLSECVDSILRQNFKDFELILVDDGSKDSSWNTIKEYADKDKRVVPIHQENAGVSAARNKGLVSSHGKWICFVDPDDFLPKDGLYQLYKHGDRNNADLVIGNFMRVEKGKYRHGENLQDAFYNNDVPYRIKRNAVWGQLFKSRIIEDIDICFTNGMAYSEDNLFLAKYIMKCQTIEFIKNIVYYYNVNDDSVVQSKNAYKKAYHQIWAASEIYNLRSKNVQFDDFLLNRSKELLKLAIDSYILKVSDCSHLNELNGIFNHFFREQKDLICYYYCNIFLKILKRLLKFRW